MFLVFSFCMVQIKTGIDAKWDTAMRTEVAGVLAISMFQTNPAPIKYVNKFLQ